jgi:hypothetical protein
MKIATAQSRASDPASAVNDLAGSLAIDTRGKPDFVALHFGVGSVAVGLHAAVAARFGTAALHGGSSCLGIMTQDGVNIASGAGLGALAIWVHQCCEEASGFF